ncbi:MAG: hypothetical protein NUV85_02245 [Candidatus Berkelbacteria bacterium]|nr:hypothetical protein [Candidatus Berkelbacteria bacterium]
MKTLYANQYLSEIATTRLKAKELFSVALKSKAEAISFKDIDFASRSFLHEILSLADRKKIELTDCNPTIIQLIELIESSKSRPIAPVLEIRRVASIKI